MLFKKLNSLAIAPTKSYSDDAGWDLYSVENIQIDPGKFRRVKTGIAVAIPPGHHGEVCPRSGLANKYGLTVLNSPGIIDAGYRGEVEVLLINHGERTAHIEIGDRIAQIIEKSHVSVMAEVIELPESDRHARGFGSSGR